ncbi:hypothetical protein [Nostoc sp. C110]|uniref:hypothetical protein n=1 Tax=Nostoc sp. C110 TaxID=3349876 RepID=UPI00370DC2AD
MSVTITIVIHCSFNSDSKFITSWDILLSNATVGSSVITKVSLLTDLQKVDLGG